MVNCIIRNATATPTMAIRFRPYIWSDDKRRMVECPLDDADAVTIQIARRYAKGEIDEDEAMFLVAENSKKFN